MSDKMKIDVALANLESGKFSFQMIDAIKEHIGGLENELEVVRGLHDSAVRDLKLQEIANWRLEGELRKLNAQIYAVLRANLLTQKTYAGMTFVAMKMGAYFEASRKIAAPALEQVTADLKTGKLQSQCVDAAAKLYALPREIMPAQSAYRELTPYAHKLGKYLAVSKKSVGVQLDKASAYLVNLRKTAT